MRFFQQRRSGVRARTSPVLVHPRVLRCKILGVLAAREREAKKKHVVVHAFQGHKPIISADLHLDLENSTFFFSRRPTCSENCRL